MEKSKAIQQICDDFCNIFHLKNDVLFCTIAIAQDICTHTNSVPENVRPYRPSEKYKEEANKQIKDMLEEKIIRHSTSQ